MRSVAFCLRGCFALAMLLFAIFVESAAAQPTTLFTTGLTSVPLAIAPGADGNLWFTEYYRIGRITPSGVITEFNVGPDNLAIGLIAAGADGNIWFTEFGNTAVGARLARITPFGSVTEFSEGFAVGADFAGLTGAPDRNLWFTQSDGFTTSVIGRRSPAGVITLLHLADDADVGAIASGPDGNLWFVEHTSRRIGRITPTNVITEFEVQAVPNSYVRQITGGSDGNLWFTDEGAGRIGRLSPAGAVSYYTTGLPPGTYPSAITLGSDGTLWFTEASNTKIGRITTTGEITEFVTDIMTAAGEGAYIIDIASGPDGNLWFTYAVETGGPFVSQPVRWGIGRMTPPASPSNREIARLEIVSGDRQISVNSSFAEEPFVVRAVDAAGSPVPNVQLLIGPTVAANGPVLIDEFGFRGFNAAPLNLYTALGFPSSQYLAITDADGMASARGRIWDTAPSSFVVGATQWPRRGDVQAFFSIVAAETMPSGNPSVVVEYAHKPTGHYFNTLMPSEIDSLDAGLFTGWARSTGSFIAYATQQDAAPGAVPVCRFFSSLYTAHFFTADPIECQIVIDRWPDVWTLETRAAFYVFEPDKTTGQCAAGLQPVYRLYSTRNGPNHRYVTDRQLRDVMVAAGWTAEGYGLDAVVLCTPR